MANIAKMALVVTANAETLGADLGKMEGKVARSAKAMESKLGGAGKGASPFAGIADRTAASLGKAQGAIGKFADAKARATEGGGSGLLGGLAGGALVAGLALAKQSLGKMLALVDSIKEDAAKMGVTFSDEVVAGIDGAQGALFGVKKAGLSLFGEVLAAAEPAITAFSHVLIDALDAAKPVITWLIDKVGTYLTIAFQAVVGVVKIVAGQVMELWDSFAGAAGVSSWFDNWPSWEQLVKMALKAMYTGFAFTWDAIKAGLGGLAAYWGVMAKAGAAALEGIGKAVSWLTEKLGKLLSRMGDAAKAAGWDSMAEKLSAAGTALEGFSEKDFTSKWADKLRNVGDGAIKFGQKLASGFGQTKVQIDDMIDKIQVRTDRLTKELPLAYTAVGATIQGSTGDVSIQAKFKTEGVFKEQKDAAKMALEEAKKGNNLLKKIADNTGKGLEMEAI